MLGLFLTLEAVLPVLGTSEECSRSYSWVLPKSPEGVLYMLPGTGQHMVAPAACLAELDLPSGECQFR